MLNFLFNRNYRNGPSLAAKKTNKKNAEKNPTLDPLAQLNAELIERDLRRDINRGLYSRPAWTFKQMAGIVSVLGDKVRFWAAQVSALEWKIAISREATEKGADPALLKKAEAQRDALTKRYEQFRNLRAALKHMAKGRFYGFSACRVYPNRLEPIHPWNMIHDVEWQGNESPTFSWYFNQKAEMQFKKNDMPPMRVGDYAIREDDDASMLELMRLAFRVMRVMDFRETNLEAASKNQVIILTGGKMPEPGTEEYNNLISALKAARDGESAVIAKGDPNCPTEVVRGEASKGLPFYNTALDQLDQMMTKAVTGGMLTMLSMPTGIGQGASGEHDKTLRALISDEAGSIAEAFWEAIDIPCLQATGLLEDGESPLAWFELTGREAKSAEKGAELLGKIRQAGYSVATEQASDMVDLDLTEMPGGQTPGGFPSGARGFLNRAGMPAGTLKGMDKNLAQFFADIAQKFGGGTVPDDVWFDALENAIAKAPAEVFGSSEALEEYLTQEMEKAWKAGEKDAKKDHEDLANSNGFDPSQPRDSGGKWLGTGGSRSRTRELKTKGKRDNFGTTDEQKLLNDPKLAEKRSKSVITHLLSQKIGSEDKVVYRKDTGWIGVDYGTPGNPNNKYEGGHGLNHIFAKHKEVTPDSLCVVLHKGEAFKHDKSRRKLYLIHGNSAAIVTKINGGRLLITDYEEVSNQQIATYKSRGKYHAKGEN